MSLPRDQVCRSSARKLTAAIPSLKSQCAFIGFDGFVDEIAAVVNTRQSAGAFEPIERIDHFGKKVLAAANQSTNFELVIKQTKIGGNGPIMANALAGLGMNVTCAGSLGYPQLHPVFAELSRRAKVVGIAPPGHTTALEFSDGKLMLGKLQGLTEVTWDNLLERIGQEKLIELLSPARLIGIVNWTMLPEMSRIWQELGAQIFPSLPRQRRTMMVDLADPEKRTAADIAAGLKILSKLQEQIDVVLGLNLKESSIIANVLNISVPRKEGESEPGESAIEQTAIEIRRKLQIGCVVIHPRKAAAAAMAQDTARFDGPFVQNPKISTGAGDHFNAGFCLAHILDFSLEESLCMGLGLSGYYVRTAQSPDADQLAQFLADLPLPS